MILSQHESTKLQTYGGIEMCILLLLLLLFISRSTPCPEKKGATLFLPVTLWNANRFSKFFYHHTLQ